MPRLRLRRPRRLDGDLVCPRCGSRAAVRAAVATEERTDAELAAIAGAVPDGADLAEDG